MLTGKVIFIGGKPLKTKNGDKTSKIQLKVGNEVVTFWCDDAVTIKNLDKFQEFQELTAVFEVSENKGYANLKLISLAA